MRVKVNSSQYLTNNTEYEWLTCNGYLHKSYIEKAILGLVVIGWFAQTCTNVLGIDIDDHKGVAWTGSEPSPQLLSTYNQILNVFPRPSLLVQSPRGLHVYYILNDRIPWNIIEKLAREKLHNTRCELRPTPNLALRIPEKKRILDPTTLLPVMCGEINRYHPAILFNDKYLPKYIRDTLQDRKHKLRHFLYSPKISQLESSYTPLIPGSSNDTLNALIPAYKKAGLCLEDAVYRFTSIVQQSPLYNGELKNQNRLEQRIRSYYKKSYTYFIPKPKERQLNLLHKPLVDKFVSLSPFAPQRNKIIEMFLYRVLNWCEWHDEILQDPKNTSYFDYLYPWYRKNRKAGYYPIPTSFLRKANFRYHSIWKWLKNLGFIEEAPFKYSPKDGICKYYKVNKEKCDYIYKEHNNKLNKSI